MGAVRWRTGGGWFAGGAGLVLVAGCSDLLGFEHSITVKCALNSDCPDTLFCTEGYCTVQCNLDRDCRPDQRCEDNRCRAASIPEVDAASETGGGGDGGEAGFAGYRCV